MYSRERLTKERKRKRNINQTRDGTDRVRQDVAGRKIPRNRVIFCILLCGQVLLTAPSKVCEIPKVPPNLLVGKAQLTPPERVTMRCGGAKDT